MLEVNEIERRGVMTRIERIRSMTTEEMAQMIIKEYITDEFCKSDCGEDDCPHELQCCIKWLEEETHE